VVLVRHAQSDPRAQGAIVGESWMRHDDELAVKKNAAGDRPLQQQIFRENKLQDCCFFLFLFFLAFATVLAFATFFFLGGKVVERSGNGCAQCGYCGEYTGNR
jgi:hypothetical protein